MVLSVLDVTSSCTFCIKAMLITVPPWPIIVWKQGFDLVFLGSHSFIVLSALPVISKSIPSILAYIMHLTSPCVNIRKCCYLVVLGGFEFDQLGVLASVD